MLPVYRRQPDGDRRRWRATPSGCASSTPGCSRNSATTRRRTGPRRTRTRAAGASTRGRSGSSAPSARRASAPSGRRRVEGAHQLEDAGHHHLGQRHGDRRTRPAPPSRRAPRLAQHHPVRRLPGRRHPRPQPGGRREERQDPRPDRPRSRASHADRVDVGARRRNEILRWLSGFQRPPRATFIVHGEYAAMQALESAIHAKLGWTTKIPEHGEAVKLA